MFRLRNGLALFVADFMEAATWTAEALEDGSFWEPSAPFYPGAGGDVDDHRDPGDWG